MEILRHMAAQVSQQVNAHPVTTAVSGISMSAISILQSAQGVASTLIALVTSLAGLFAAILSLRNAWRNRNKEK